MNEPTNNIEQSVQTILLLGMTGVGVWLTIHLFAVTGIIGALILVGLYALLCGTLYTATLENREKQTYLRILHATAAVILLGLGAWLLTGVLNSLNATGAVVVFFVYILVCEHSFEKLVENKTTAKNDVTNQTVQDKP